MLRAPGAEGRQRVELDREENDQQVGEPEAWGRGDHQGASAREVVEETVATKGCEDAQRNAEQDGQESGGARELKRRGEAASQLRCDRQPAGVRGPEVAVYGVLHPVDVSLG